LSCDDDSPQAGNFRSESTRVVKVNRPKLNRRKTGPPSQNTSQCFKNERRKNNVGELEF